MDQILRPDIIIPVTLSPLDKYRGRGKPRQHKAKSTTVRSTTVNVINKPHFVTFN